MPTQTPSTVPDLFSPEFTSDPHASYRSLRVLGPVHDDVHDLWILSRHADVLEALHQPTVFSSEQGYGQFMSGAIGPASGSRANVLGFRPDGRSPGDDRQRRARPHRAASHRERALHQAPRRRVGGHGPAALAERGIDLQPAGPAVRTANTVLPGYSSIPVTAG